MGTETKTRYTYPDLASFPDDLLRREIIDGELIATPSPGTRHQRAVGKVLAALHFYAKEHGGEAYPPLTDVYLAEDNVVEPDALYLDKAGRHQIEEMFIRGAPNVVVEVSSPATRRLELVRKLELYQRFGVPEYWYVDIQADRIEIHRLIGGRYAVPTLLRRGDVLRSEQVPGFELPVDDILGPEEDEPTPADD